LGGLSARFALALSRSKPVRLNVFLGAHGDVGGRRSLSGSLQYQNDQNGLPIETACGILLRSCQEKQTMIERRRILIASNDGISIRCSADISDALGACLGSEGVILTENALTPEFFDLRTGLAGELFQKFINYKVRVAIVLLDPEAYGERFTELAREHSSHGMIRFVRSLDEATSWLNG
jgi:hypothetical protein